MNLDDKENGLDKINSQNSKYSCYLGVVSILILLNIGGFTYLKLIGRISSTFHSKALPILTLLLVVIGVGGIVMGVKSLQLKEPNSPQKIIGLISNSIVLIIFIVILALFLFDINKLFNS